MTATAATMIRFAEGMSARSFIELGEVALPALAVLVALWVLSPGKPPRTLGSIYYR